MEECVPYTDPFWEALEDGRFLIQACTDCGDAYFPPAPVCPNCHSEDVNWVESTAEGELYSFTKQHRTAAGFDSPVVLATIDLAEGPRLLVRMDEKYEDLSIGASVELRPIAYSGGAERGRLADHPFFRGCLA